MCAYQLDEAWIDDGTMCRSQSSAPGPVGLTLDRRRLRRDPFASALLGTAKLVYSKAKEATWKRSFDEEIAAAGIQIVPTNGTYWRLLIRCLSEARVDCIVEGLQFFVIRGGYEGFLSKDLRLTDANKVHWDGREGTTDLNDVLVVLDENGNYVGAYQLAVPNYYPRTAKMVATDWEGRAVFSYWNDTYSYRGLAVLDRGKLPRYDPKVGKYAYWIDIHHKLGTLGCIEVAAGASKEIANFDAFLHRLEKAHGRKVEEQYAAGKKAEYQRDPAATGKSGFTVSMEHYLGRISVLAVPELGAPVSKTIRF